MEETFQGQYCVWKLHLKSRLSERGKRERKERNVIQ